jgi:hypothetical protein
VEKMSVISSARIPYAQRTDATPAAELSALANIYRLVCDSASRKAAGVASTNGDGATVKNGKEVTHVDQRPG